MINCPCVNCEKKGCGVYHDKCEKFLAFKRESAAEAEKRKEFYATKRIRIINTRRLVK